MERIDGGDASGKLRNGRSVGSLVFRGIAKAARGFAKIAPLLAIGVAVGVAFGASATKSKPAKISTPAVSCPSGNLFTFENNNTYPIWLGEAYQGGGSFSSNIIAPPDNDWMMAAGTSVSLCMPSGWSGNFWARTGCDFVTPFNNDPNYQSCTATSDCASQHICYGGECLLECTSGSTVARLFARERRASITPMQYVFRINLTRKERLRFRSVLIRSSVRPATATDYISVTETGAGSTPNIPALRLYRFSS